MIDIVSIDQCVLCGSCVDSCPVGAISFEKEHHGSKYPQIDGQRCIGCQRCEQACPVLNIAEDASRQEPMGYAAMHTDDAVRKESSSGGVFAALADAVISAGGYVCGAVLTEDLSVEHIVSNDPKQIVRMRGSKYVQSRMTGVYREIEKLVKQNIPVLFSGCPCQAAALKTFLGNDYPSLYIADVICHGIPSISSWRTYLIIQEKRYKSRVEDVQFRDKSKGWHSSSVKLRFSNGKELYVRNNEDIYYKNAFIGNVTLKESCYQCVFRGCRSGSDLTLGDFWGAEVALPDMDDNKGLSAVLVHTEKGKELLERIGVEKRNVSYELILRGNKNLEQSPLVSPKRSPYYACAEKEGEVAAMESFLVESIAQRYRRKIRYLLRRMKHAVTGKKTLY